MHRRGPTLNARPTHAMAPATTSSVASILCSHACVHSWMSTVRVSEAYHSGSTGAKTEQTVLRDGIGVEHNSAFGS